MPRGRRVHWCYGWQVNLDKPRSHWTVPVLRGFLGILLMIVLLLWLSPEAEAWRSLFDIDTRWLIAAMASTIFASCVTAWRWMLLAQTLGRTRNLGWTRYFQAFWINRAAGQLSSTLAMDLLGRSWSLGEQKGSQRPGFHTELAILERISDVLLPAASILVLYALELDTTHSLSRVSVFIAGIFAMAAGLSATFNYWATAANRSIGIVRSIFLRVYSRTPISILEKSVDECATLRPLTRTGIVSLSLARYVFVVFQFASIGFGVNLAIEWGDFVVGTAFAQASSLLAITPGGLGIQEIGWAGALRITGITSTQIALFLVAQRVYAFGSSLLFGAIAWAWQRVDTQSASVPQASVTPKP